MEILIEHVKEHVTIVERPAFRLVGFRVAITPESQSLMSGPNGYGGLTDWAFVRKLVMGGELKLLAEELGVGADAEILCARWNVRGDGDFDILAGFEVAEGANLPVALPEGCAETIVPAARYVRMEVNQSGSPDRTGFPERMHANEYFIGEFRKDTRYGFDAAGSSFAAFDRAGDLVYECTPVKADADWLSTLRTKIVSLPPMMIACKTANGDNVIFEYFQVEKQVLSLSVASCYAGDYYGFPIDIPGGWTSCFGSRVTSFDGIPDCVDRVTLPGGLYLHIWELEYNGDNPTLPYRAAFERLDEAFLSDHPEYRFDTSRKVIARFRQANCASVFVPLSPAI